MAAADLDLAYRLFTTTVGFITTNGSKGPNVMSAEWTFNVSYEPFLIMVLLEPGEATYEAVQETGEFGVSLTSEDQVVGMGFAGHFTKRDTEKLSSELFETYPGKKINVPMLKGALLNAECRVVQSAVMGDHTAFVGEVLELSVDPSKRPVVLHRGAHALGPRIPRPPAIAVAATPMAVSAGGKVVVAGEFAAPARAQRPMEILLLDPEGQRIESAATKTDGGGYFEAEIRIPGDARTGRYTVAARSDSVEGRARLIVG